MVTVVDCDKEIEEVANLLSKPPEKKPILIPYWNDGDKHVKEDSLLAIAISFQGGPSFFLSVSHPEVNHTFDELEFLDGVSFYSVRKKQILQEERFQDLDLDLTDIGLMKWFHSNDKLETDLLPLYFKTFPRSGPKVKNQHIPVYQFCEKLNNIFPALRKRVNEFENIEDSSAFEEYNSDVINVFSKVESNGIAVKHDLFENTFKEKIGRSFGDLVYTDYELYTSTGRPSNSSYNINFAALDPSKNQKDPFVSRFEDGILLQCDYDAFHLRLIGNLIGYDLPGESFHSYLGKKYFDKNTLTDEEYKDSKKITFQFLYGKDIEEARNVKYFDKTFDFRDRLWDAFKAENRLITPVYKREIPGRNIPEVNPGKAFSYLIQSFETEFNVEVMSDLIELLKNYKSELVLYTYDAFLFDFCLEDGKGLIKKIKNQMERKNMKVKASIGKSYGNMDNLGF